MEREKGYKRDKTSTVLLTSCWVPEYIANSIEAYMKKENCNKSTAIRRLLEGGINWAFFIDEG